MSFNETEAERQERERCNKLSPEERRRENEDLDARIADQNEGVSDAVARITARHIKRLETAAPLEEGERWFCQDQGGTSMGGWRHIEDELNGEFILQCKTEERAADITKKLSENGIHATVEKYKDGRLAPSVHVQQSILRKIDEQEWNKRREESNAACAEMLWKITQAGFSDREKQLRGKPNKPERS